MSIKRVLPFLGFVALVFACQPTDRVSFNDDIRPILNEHCVGCHGGVKQSGGFGLVFRENALGETTSGHFAIVPGRPGRSELIARLRHEDPELRMPLDGPALPDTAVALLERWIAEGAEWETHWAYQPVAQPAPPATTAPWVANPVDGYVLTALQKQNLAPAAPADKRTLLRRVYFDLTGLPPTPEVMAAFLADDRPAAYAEVVDSLLASPRFGEHWASRWLDLARYADSRGYERDAGRTIWKYRDWVIDALNRDLPFDRFTVEQLAGDLLPDPTPDQLLATAFHRNTLSNDEGGSNNEEFRVATVIDRVNTTYEAWLGTTMSCVQCHSHPYDPIRHEEFYTSFAFFNNTADHDHASEAPYLSVFRSREEAKLQSLEAYVEREAGAAERRRWSMLLRLGEPRLRAYDFENVSGGIFTDRADEDVMYLHDGDHFSLSADHLAGAAALHLNYHQWHREPATVELRIGSPTGEKIAETTLERRPGPFSSKRVVVPAVNDDLYFVIRGKAGPKLVGMYAVRPEPGLPGTGDERAALTAFIDSLLLVGDSLRTPIMVERPADRARVTRVFNRGNWLVPTDTVRPAVPALLPPLAAAGPANRLAFAEWIIDPDNPLTARVAVNRFWAGIFGRGLVATQEDFGSQGDPPTHPELLDWLAWEFSHGMDWSVKELLRTLVLSSTYQQSSVASAALLAADPHNERLARGPRGRLSAEEVRDQLLAVSGLLSAKMYGPGVMPPQPDGLWDDVPYSGMKWSTSEGEDRHRRSVYTYLRRSVPHPFLTTFDGTNREVCLSRRTETNTPLQALMVLNDPVTMEAANQLVVSTYDDSSDVRLLIDRVYARLCLPPPEDADVATLTDLFHEARNRYADDAEAAVSLTGSDDPGLAAAVLVVNAIFNLDVFLTTT